MQQIGTGIYVHTEFKGCNVGLIETREGNILIDTPMVPSDNQKWINLIRQATGGKRTLYVINTDHHRGHVLGNQFYNAPVIAHDLAWKNMRGYGANFCQRVVDSFKREPKVQAELANLQIVRPTITFDTRLDIEHGGRTVRLIHVGGHTEATILIWLPEEKILFSGDTVWCDQHPYMAQANSKQWLEALSFIRKLNPQVIVPGHGPLTTPDSTVPLSEYIRYVRRQVRSRIRRGYSKQETASSLVKGLVPMFPVPSDRRGKIESQIKQGINRIYNEYKKGSDTKSKADHDEDGGEFEEFDTPPEEDVEVAEGADFVDTDTSPSEDAEPDIEADEELDLHDMDDKLFDDNEDLDDDLDA